MAPFLTGNITFSMRQSAWLVTGLNSGQFLAFKIYKLTLASFSTSAERSSQIQTVNSPRNDLYKLETVSLKAGPSSVTTGGSRKDTFTS